MDEEQGPSDQFPLHNIETTGDSSDEDLMKGSELIAQQITSDSYLPKITTVHTKLCQ